MAERKGSAFRRVLAWAERFSDAAIAFGSLKAKTPVSRSSAFECSVTCCDQRLDFAVPVRFLGMALTQDTILTPQLDASCRVHLCKRGIRGRPHALSRRTVALLDRPLDARRVGRALRSPSAELGQRGAARTRLSRRQSHGQGAGAEARRHRNHRGRGDLYLSRRRISTRAVERAGRRSAPRHLSQMALLWAVLH